MNLRAAHLRHLLPALLLAILLSWACNPTKRLAEDEYLLKKNKIVFEGNPEVTKDELREVIRPEPNRKILGFRFYLWAYNVPDPEKIDEKTEERREKLEQKNQKRILKGKEPKVLKPYGSWWQETVGEAPVIYSPEKVAKSAEQLQTYLIKHGYFNAKVKTDSIVYENKQMKSAVYKIDAKQPYLIDSIRLNIPDQRLLNLTREARNIQTNISTGQRFNIDELDKERERLTEYFRNRGYFNFNKQLIYFDVDSSLNRHAVNLELGIIPRKVPYEGDPDSLVVKPHKRYTLRKIKVIDTPLTRNTQILGGDTTVIRDYLIIDQDQLNVKPKIIAQNILFRSDDYYELDAVTRTYQRLSTLPIVRAASITFEPVSQDLENTELDVNIALTPNSKQNFSFEWNGTNQGGFLGIAGALAYQNRNIFGGAEKLTLEIRGGLEAQQLLTESSQDDGFNEELNTIEFGPQVSLTFPKFLLPIRAEKFAKSANPKTTLTANLSYQRRPDYERTRSFGSISYRWNESDRKAWQISPLELSLIKIQRSSAFDQRLEEINDPFLTNSFQDHFIQNLRITYTYNTQRTKVFQKDFFFYRAEFESAGTLLRGIYQIANADTDQNGSYEILGIDFAHYLKTIQDLRFYHVPNSKMSTAYRLSGGVGVPLENLNVLPFEKSFFGGGANDIRAWQARTLGPGSFRDPEENFDKIGDILLEANVEYRFDITQILEGAFFVDAGNIWNIRSDPARPGADFETDRFLSEIAFGVGTGTRFNFDFFLIRLDIGLQVKDPALDRGERWLFQDKSAYNDYIDRLNANRDPADQLPYYRWQWNLNIGIGYPF